MYRYFWVPHKKDPDPYLPRMMGCSIVILERVFTFDFLPE
jgi:hypothetical protein